MEKQKFFSPVLCKEITLELSPASTGPTHAGLIQILYDELIPLGVKIETEWAEISSSHSVVEVTLHGSVNGQPRVVREIGEALPASLATEIAQQYPSLTAYKRGIDRAILSYLALYGVYAATEGVKQEFSTAPTAPPAAPPAATPTTPPPQRNAASIQAELNRLADTIIPLSYGPNGPNTIRTMRATQAAKHSLPKCKKSAHDSLTLRNGQP